ncbi:MAG: GntR family transcriptional regulator [Chloroflexota bacterium]|nr:MAG: GntR family transcriptional regulator [Chloroflexota bacterium]
MYPETIDRYSKLPFYQQLYEILLNKIQQGEWQPGDMIPPESELIENYQVSRNTVRQVLDMLVNEGLIYRQRGRGTFVAHPSLEQSMTRIVSFTEDMQQREFTPGTQVLSATLLPAEAEIAAKLQIQTGEQLACLRRLRLADGEPMSIEESYLVHSYCPEILQHDYAQQPLRKVLETDFGIRIASAKQVIKAILAPPELIDLLDIKTPAVLLFIERVSFSQGKIPVEFLRIYYRADRYSLFNELHE